MTDKQALLSYRLRQAEETIADAEKMVESQVSPRSIANRAYYSMFYCVLALFLKTGINIKTSKHSGVISVFNKEFVHTGKIDKHYSKILQKMFNIRQECDYKEFAEISIEDAEAFVNLARQFFDVIKKFIDKEPV